MKIVVFSRGEVSNMIGVVSESTAEQRVIDVTEMVGWEFGPFLAKGREGVQELREKLLGSSLQSYAMDSIRIDAPVLAHARIFGIGLNYADHAAESKMQTQTVPTVFLKLASSVIGHGRAQDRGGGLGAARCGVHDCERCERARRAVCDDAVDAGEELSYIHSCRPVDCDAG
jgi:2-keto-4-pentenoate hydratase/2-oxohepta-3-ene-1,7-dioic acid hydratase in catechol pathway